MVKPRLYYIARSTNHQYIPEVSNLFPLGGGGGWRGVNLLCVKPTSHLQLLSRLRICGAILPLTHITSFLAQELYLLLSRSVYCSRSEFDTMDIVNDLELSAWVDRHVMMSLPLQDYKWGSIAVCALIKLVDGLTLRLLMSYIYGAPILDVSRSHTTTQHSR